MSNKMRPYVVHQGDYLNKIAFKHGFIPDEVWNDEANSDLRARRRSPDQLYPGDVLYIPTTEPTGFRVSAGAGNLFAACVPTVPLALVFEADRMKLATEPCEVRGMPGSTVESPLLTATDSEGALRLDVPVLVREFEVFFPRLNAVYAVRIGDMDPESELSGIKKRLRNLGYLSLNPHHREDDVLVPGALKAFQAGNDLPTSGQIDDATTAKLLKEHRT